MGRLSSSPRTDSPPHTIPSRVDCPNTTRPWSGPFSRSNVFEPVPWCLTVRAGQQSCPVDGVGVGTVTFSAIRGLPLPIPCSPQPGQPVHASCGVDVDVHRNLCLPQCTTVVGARGFFLHCGVYESRSAVWPQGEVPRLLGGRNRERRAEKGSCMGRGAGVPRYPLPTPLGRFCPRTRTLAGFCPRTRARRPRRQRMRRAAPSGFRCGVPASDPSVLAYSYRVR